MPRLRWVGFESADFTDGKGGFGGLENMIKQLSKLRKLTDVGKTSLLKDLFGDDAETIQVVKALIDKGKEGYDQVQQKMNSQASLNKRVEAQLSTLANLWDAMTGTATNGLAAIGGAFSGEAKDLTSWLGDLADRFSNFAAANPRVIRSVVGLAAGLVTLKLGFLGVGGALGVVSKIIAMSPWGRFLTLISMAAGLIITNWDVIGPYFKKLWDTISPLFEVGWALIKKVFDWSPLGIVINNWGPIIQWFKDMWDTIEPYISWLTSPPVDGMSAGGSQWGQGGTGIYGSGVASPGYNPYAINQTSQNSSATVTVEFKDAPQGMRVTDTKPDRGLSVNHDVGYTRIGKFGMGG